MGRKKLFNKEEEEQIKQWVLESPKNPKKVITKIKKEWSKTTTSRIIKGNKINWRRIRKIVGEEPLSSFYQKKVVELEGLKKREEQGEIEIRYVMKVVFV